MADAPSEKDLLPSLLAQNPSSVKPESQDYIDKKQAQVDHILAVFRKLLPSNYVSQVQGPHYSLRFQAAAEQIADFQITAQEAFADGFWEYTRPEFLFQILGLLVFPDAQKEGVPTIHGDISYRNFLQEMVKLLLAGATKATVQSGLELLSNAVFEVIERGVEARKMGPLSGWGVDDKFTFEINVSGTSPNTFPADPFVLQENVRLVLKALKPAHTLYDYRHLFRETFGQVFQESLSWNLQSYYYADFRKNCLGAKQINGTLGVTWADRSLFSDPTRDFSSVCVGATLVVLTGPNSTVASLTDPGYVGHYEVTEILQFPALSDTPRAYTTSPTGLTGFGTVSNGMDIEDTSQNWALAIEGEQISFTDGPNAGTYRLKTLLGNDGGPLGQATGPATRVRIAPSLLRIYGWMSQSVTGQEYYVTLDRLGQQVPREVIDEDVSPYFVPGPPTVSTFLTRRGPLVKNWGDATPATVQDVSVTVNAVPVTVASVNPYLGEITLAVPVPTFPAPTVLVSYYWFATPVMALAGWNTPGLVYNKWDLSGRLPSIPRFPMGVVYGPNVPRRQPVLIAHRYIGFEQAYTASYNSPTTLLYNQDPKRVSVPGFERMPPPVSVAYEGVQRPTASSTRAWALSGTDAGGVNTGIAPLAGTYTVKDINGGSFSASNPSAVIYYRGVDLSFPSAVSVVCRFFVTTESFTSPDGVFSGVGFGVHNNERLYLVGLVTVNGVQHIGFLLNAEKPHLAESWRLGPQAAITIQNSTTFTVPTALTPTDLRVSERFQILSGTQAGVYTIQTLVRQTTGVSTITVTPAFPANPGLWGNKYVDVVFEGIWLNEPSTYRLNVDPDTGSALVTVSGTTVGTIIAVQNNAPLMPQPASTTLLISPGINGQVFWGSLSWKATNSSTWSFVRYSVQPDETVFRDHRLNVVSEMTQVPELDSPPWFMTQAFGWSQAAASSLLLKSVSASDTLDFTFGYARVEPFLAPKTTVDLRSIYRVESGNLGSGDALIVLNNSQREVRLGTLLYWETTGLIILPGMTPPPFRQLLTLPSVSFCGLLSPFDQQFLLAQPPTGTYSSENHGRVYRLSTASQYGVAGRYQLQDTADITGQVSSLLWTDTRNRIIEAQFAVTAWQADGADFVGNLLIMGAGGRGIVLGLVAGLIPKIRLMDYAQNPIQDYVFDWTDQAPHAYRIVTDWAGDTLVLFIDGVLQVPTVVLSLFTLHPANVLHIAGYHTNAAQSMTVEWYSASYVVQPPADAKRTLGIWLKGSKNDIDNWEVPRTDSLTVPNSDALAAIEEMDWRSDMNVRLLWDPDWGVTLYRPDLPLPPYYVPDLDVIPPYNPIIGGGFATEISEPSAGWINVERANVPAASSIFGSVAFGALDSRSITQQHWDRISYALYTHPTEDYRAPQHMVWNQHNVINSGELSKDRTPETMTVETVSFMELSLIPTHLYADRVFKVIDGAAVFTSEMYTFDRTTQTLLLEADSEGNPRSFSAQHATVTVVYAPGKTVTNTYLLNQPLLDGVTLLNEGTPPVPKGQTAKYDRYVVFGPDIVESTTDMRSLVADVSNPVHVLSDPYRVSTFVRRTESLYDAMSFYELSNAGDGPCDGKEGLLSTICEGLLTSGDSGYDPAPLTGEPIYSPTGGGPPSGGVGASGNLFETGNYVGVPFGPFVLNFSGATFMEVGFGPKQSWSGTGGGFIASGGGITGTLLAPSGTLPMGILEPMALDSEVSNQVLLTMIDTTSGAITRRAYVG